MSRFKVIVLLLLGLGVVALAVTVSVRGMHWHDVCEANRDKFGDNSCAVHALLGSLSETRPFSWFLSLTPTARSLELIEATERYDALVAAGRHADALPHAMNALWLHVRVFGSKHPHNATLLDNLAALHRAQGEDEVAAGLESQAAAIRAKHGN